MARQKIVNICPYNKHTKLQQKCKDYKTIKSFHSNNIICKYRECNDVCIHTIDLCTHKNPTVLYGYNLTDEEINKYIKSK